MTKTRRNPAARNLDRQRVVVTGMGLVSPLGHSPEELWEGLIEGRSAVRPITRFDPGRFTCRLAAEVDGFELPDLPGPHAHEASQMDRFVQYALRASADAFAASRLPAELLTSKSGGFYLGVAMGGLETLESGFRQQEAEGPEKINPYLIAATIPNMAAGMVALMFGFAGPQYTIVGGCSSGIQAIGQAVEAIRSGQQDWALAGGTEAVITPITFSGFQAMGILTQATEMKATPRPFDRGRDGMIVGEGAGMLVLESRDAALERGAPILAEVSGYATCSVTSQPFFQCSEATAHCTELVLEDAGLEPGDLDYVYAHAGGLAGDVKELQALRKVCDPESMPAVTSVKGHMGYSFAAAGPLDVIAAVLALREQRLSPILHFIAPEPEYSGFDLVDRPRDQHLCHGLVNSFGLGGVTASLVVSEADHRS